MAVLASGGLWAPLGDLARLGTGSALVAWRSDDTNRPSWSAATAVEAASRWAPLALWPGAGTGQVRGGLLRAHPLVEDGVLTGPVFGRRVAHGSVEYARPVVSRFEAGVSIAGFVDAARAWHRHTGTGPSPLYLDAGVGLRVHTAGSGGTFRIDAAHPIGGGGLSVSAGWSPGWPR